MSFITVEHRCPMWNSSELFSFTGPAAVVAMVGILASTGGFPREALAADDAPARIVADQIRRQGYRCEEPVTATRDAKASVVHSAVWVLDCNGARYSVRLVPDRAATVQSIAK